ncbi:MAG: NGG1p interacting factor NIF3 [bacterium]
MKLKELYATVIEQGKKTDPRGKELVEKELQRIKKEYDDLKEDKKKDFDQEKLTNPYADTRILFGNGDMDVKNILVGVDIEGAEMMLADRLIQKGQKIDLVVSHHPEGYALANLYQVMGVHADICNQFGVSISVAEALMNERITEVQRRLLPANHTRIVDMAKLLNIPLMCVHTPADNSVSDYLQKKIDMEKPYRVSDCLDLLRKIPEYKEAEKNNVGLKVVSGSEKGRAGRVMIDMTGGTSGSKDIYERLSHTDVGTIIGMHISDEHRKEAEKNHINVIIAGHMASDTIGVNLVFDCLEEKEKLDIISCSGFRRVTGKERDGKYNP